MTVLMVDDSAEIRERLTAMLGEVPGVEIVAQAATIAEAIVAVHRLKPDVVILDLHLPDGNGLEVLRLVQREQIQTRVIVLTNYAYPQYEKRVMAAGAYAFLNKARDFIRVADLVWSATTQALSPASARLATTQALILGSGAPAAKPV
jgi:DNA-binding NarL/FixJ family response regulator